MASYERRLGTVKVRIFENYLSVLMLIGMDIISTSELDLIFQCSGLTHARLQ
jgi:hypothetical protein